jgi:hypothetical protein
MDQISGKKLTTAQMEKLIKQILSDEETTFCFYMSIVEPGVELTETEKGWLEQLEKSLMQTERPDIATYLLEHSTTLTKKNRKRLEKMV